MPVLALHTKFLGRKQINYFEIDSTQAEMWRRIENGTAENGMLISAQIQTKGKRYTW